MTEEELRIAVSVYRAIKNKSDPALRKQAEEALRSLGDRRTRAVAAMLRGIEQGELGGGTVRKLVALGHVEGQEQLYIDVLKDDVTSSYTKNEVLRHLDAMPSQAVRDYLLERLEGEENAYFASSLIMSLGRLKERRAIPLLAKELSREDRTAHHIFSLVALGKIGGPAAESVLIDYVRRPKPLHVIRTLNALAKIDVALARGEAQSILASPKAERLSTGVKETLRQY